MTDERPNPAAEAAAAAMAAGVEPEWDRLHESQGTGDSGLLRELQAIASIASFHDHLHEAGPSPGQWGPLILREEIGHGASGRVYRAWDPRVERDVALKLLDTPPASAAGARNVIEEGRLLARVKHPNVVTVYGAETIDGRVGVEMELVSGTTLARFAADHGVLGAEEASVIGRAVCRALAAIHRAGLVHRDVKAQNVIREVGGRVVLMDLGSGSEITTGRDGLTGTPLYLAPEVLSGQGATAGSDLYSLGVLLFFLVTGRYPIEAPSLEDLRAAHSAGAHQRLGDLRPELPRGFVQIVERATDPDPRGRFGTAAAFEGALTAALETTTSTVALPSRSPRTAVVVAGLALLMIAATAVWAWRLPAAGPAAAERFVIDLSERLTVPSAPGSPPLTLSRDGRILVYALLIPGTGSQIFVRPFGALDATQLEGTGDSGQPFLSPDSLHVGYHQTTSPAGRMAISRLDGTGTQTVVIDWPQPAGASWGDDGTIVYSSAGNLWRIPSVGGTPVRLTSTDAGAGELAVRPKVLANGSVLFTWRRRGEPNQVALLSGDGSITVLIEGENARHMAPDLLVFQRANVLMAVRFDPNRRRVAGQGVQVAATTSEWFDVSLTGTLVQSAAGPRSTAGTPHLVWVDRQTGAETPLNLPANQEQYLPGSLRLSPDSRRFAVVVRGTSSQLVDGDEAGRIWIADLQRGTLQPLTSRPARPLGWTHDGRFVSYVNDEAALVRKLADGGGPEEVVAPATIGPFEGCSRAEWAPEDRQAILACGGDLFVLTLPTAEDRAAGPTLTPWLQEEFIEGSPELSPDGRWLAYHSNRGGRVNIYVSPFPGPGPITHIPGNAPTWLGKELIFMARGGPHAAQVRTTPTLSIGPGIPLRPQFPYLVGTGTLGFHVSADGQRFLVLKGESRYGLQALTRLMVALHWGDEVTQALEGR